MKKQLLYLFLGICLLQVAGINGLKAQTVSYKANWGSASVYIFSELNGFIVPYGFEMTVSGASPSVNITKLRINTSVNTAGMFDISTTTPMNKVARLLQVASADATLATAAGPSIGTVTLNPTYIEITLDAAHQNYTNGTYYFYLGLYVDLNNFIAAKNAIRPINNLQFSLPTAVYAGNSFSPGLITQLPPPDELAIPNQIDRYNLGIVYQWKGTADDKWETVDNWVFRDEDNINVGIPATNLPDMYDRCYFGEVPFINQPVVRSNPNTGSLLFFPNANQQIILTVNSPYTMIVTGNIRQQFLTKDYLAALPGRFSTLTGTGILDVKSNIQIGDPDFEPPSSNLGDKTTLTSSITSLLLRSSVIFRPGNSHTEFILEGGDMKITTGIISYNATNGRSTFSIIPKAPSTTANLNFLHSTPLEKIEALNANGIPVVVSSGLTTIGQNFMDFNHPGSTVSFTGNVNVNYPATKIYADRFIPNTTLSYYNLDLRGTSIKQTSAGLLQISGGLEVRSGKLDVITNNTQLDFNGDVAQTITDFNSNGGNGVAFKNVSFSGSGIKTLARSPSNGGRFSIAPTGILTMNGSATLAAGPSLLTLKSDATGSASVAAIPSTAKIMNTVNVERWLTGGNSTYRGYRLLSSPVNASSSITGTGNIDMKYIGLNALTAGPLGGTNGFTVANNNPTMYVYQETEIAPTNTTFNSGKNKGILKIHPSGNVNIFGETADLPIPVGNGYIFYYIGNNLSTVTAPSRVPDHMAITSNGTLNQGNVPVKIWSRSNNFLSYTPTSSSSIGHNMVGNPYASTIDLDKVMGDNPTVNTTVYQLSNINPGQKYLAYSLLPGNSDPGSNRYAVSGQGFIVVANNASSTLTFNEAQKVPTQQLTSPVLLMGTPIATNVVTGFYMKLEQDSVLNDYCGIYFRNDWTANFDQDDAIDLDGASPKVYMSSFSADGVRTAINRYPDYTQRMPIKLYVSAVTGGDYKLKIEDIRNIDPSFDIWLKDHFLMDSVNIRETKSYAFTINKNVTATFGGERFELFAKKKALPLYKLLAFNGEQVSEGVQITWKTENEADYTQFVLEKMDGSQQFIPIANIRSDGKGNYSYIDKMSATGNNAYRLKQIDPENRETFSAVIHINYQTDKPLNARFTIYPNPAVNVITVTLIETPLNNLSMNVIDSKGTILTVKSINGKETQHQVGQLPPGTYLVKLMDIKLQKVIAIGKFVKL